LTGHNPDILTCLANLSADEVFTPPKLASAMLDLLPHDLFRSPETTFLDPVCKSGVFLREIAKRLNDGLADQMPDDQKRIDHILTRQVFGLAITELTSLISRRSLYCSKKADGKFSIATAFDKPDGNIRLPKTKHKWDGTNCKYCGAPRAIFDRDESLEEYAYPFIHDFDARKAFNVKFDVIVGNPPYQMTGGGGGFDSSIYHLFVQQAMKLEPRYLCMVMPARWLAGGHGMDEFRTEMLSSGKLRKLIDYPISKEVFPGVEVKGGICYLLWEKDYNGRSNVTTIRGNERIGPVSRKLDEFDIFVRDQRAVDILHKVLASKSTPISEILTGVEPFKWPSNFAEFREKPKRGDVPLYYWKRGERGIGYVEKEDITKNQHLVAKWKVLTPKAGSGGGMVPDVVLGKPWIAPSPSVCTGSFMFFYVDSEDEANSLRSYYKTKFFRFLVSLRKITQDAIRSVYTWVPQQTWDREWTDKTLYKKYSLSDDEIAFIESVIRPMDGAE
jgi:site-specific DNA-methyltransferase (adenine-specific)